MGFCDWSATYRTILRCDPGAKPELALRYICPFDKSYPRVSWGHGSLPRYGGILDSWGRAGKYQRTAIQSEVVFMGGLAAGRVASILIDGWPHFLLTGYAVVEIGMAVAGIILLRQLPSASQDS